VVRHPSKAWRIMAVWRACARNGGYIIRTVSVYIRTTRKFCVTHVYFLYKRRFPNFSETTIRIRKIILEQNEMLKLGGVRFWSEQTWYSILVSHNTSFDLYRYTYLYIILYLQICANKSHIAYTYKTYNKYYRYVYIIMILFHWNSIVPFKIEQRINFRNNVFRGIHRQCIL